MKRIGIVLFLCAVLSASSICAQAAPLPREFSPSGEAMERALSLARTSEAMGIPQDASRILAFAAASTGGAPSGSDVTAAWRSLTDGIILRDALGEQHSAFLGYDALCRAILGGAAAGRDACFPIPGGYFYAQDGQALFGAVGTPVVAIESGCIETIGEAALTLLSEDGQRRYRYESLCGITAAAGARIGAGEVLGELCGEPAAVHISLELLPECGGSLPLDAGEVLQLLAARRSAVIWDGDKYCRVRIRA